MSRVKQEFTAHSETPPERMQEQQKNYFDLALVATASFIPLVVTALGFLVIHKNFPKQKPKPPAPKQP
jgi:hypothetical protein